MVVYTNQEYWYNNGLSFECTKNTQIVYLSNSITPTAFDIAYLPFSNSGDVQSDVGVGHNIYFVDTTGQNNLITIQSQPGEYINGTYSYSVTNPAFTTTLCTNLGSGIWSILNTANITSNSGSQGPIGPQGDIGPIGFQGATGTDFNFSTGLTVSDLIVSVDTSVIATTATLSNYWSELGSILTSTGRFGSLNTGFNTNFINNGSIYATVFSQSSNATTGPSNTVFAFLGNNATASGVLNPLGSSNIWIQGISTVTANTALLTTFNSGAGSGGHRPHIRMINGAGQATLIGMQDNAQTIILGRNNDNFLTLGSGGSIFNVSASGGAQSSVVINAGHANTSGTSIGLLITNTGNNSSTGGVASLRINNTETLSGSGIQSLIEAQRNNNTVFRVDMTGGISAGTVSNATASTWRLGKIITATSALDTTRYVEVNIDGAIIKLGVIS